MYQKLQLLKQPLEATEEKQCSTLSRVTVCNLISLIPAALFTVHSPKAVSQLDKGTANANPTFTTAADSVPGVRCMHLCTHTNRERGGHTCGARAWRGGLVRRTECRAGTASPPPDIPQPSPTLGGCVPQTVLGCGGSPLKKKQKKKTRIDTQMSFKTMHILSRNAVYSLLYMIY